LSVMQQLQNMKRITRSTRNWFIANVSIFNIKYEFLRTSKFNNKSTSH
jgi:hypothetical protein